MATTEFDMNELMKDALYEVGAECEITDYADTGRITNDTGFVIKMIDGNEFCITIQQRA